MFKNIWHDFDKNPSLVNIPEPKIRVSLRTATGARRKHGGRTFMNLIHILFFAVALAVQVKAQEPIDLVQELNNSPNYEESAVKVLGWLREGGNPDMVLDGSGNTLMHYAAVVHLRILQEAIRRDGDCEYRNQYGETPLHFAAAQDSTLPSSPLSGSVRLLGDCGADPDVQDKRGNTSLHALYEGVKGVARVFIGSQTLNGSGEAGILQALLRELDADPNILNKEGDAPLMSLIRNLDASVAIASKPGAVRVFLENGADSNTRNNAGFTPLFEALKLPNSRSYNDEPREIIALLTQYGADPDLRDRQGDTPLIFAAKNEDDIVSELEALLNGGADPCLRDREGNLAYDHAGVDGALLLYEAGGYPDQETGICMRDLLTAKEGEKKLGLNPNLRQRLQSCLKLAGFDPGMPDGLFGSRTRKAVRAWQSTRELDGIEASGYFSQNEVDNLLEGCLFDAPQPLCDGQSSGGCWMEVSNQSGCYIWNPYPKPDETVEWSGDCVDGKVSGQGRANWHFKTDGTWESPWNEGPYHEGKSVDGLHVVGSKNGEVWEGTVIDNKRHGVWVRTDIEELEWRCYQRGERQQSGNACGVKSIDSISMISTQQATIYNGPGRDFSASDPNQLDSSQVIEVTLQIGDWVTGSDIGGFVHLSDLEEIAEGYSVGEVFRDCDSCPEMVIVPAGSFMMGSNSGAADDDEQPVHEVVIPDALAVGRYEVTFSEFDACVSGGGCSHGPNYGEWGRGDHPVVNVHWVDAREYVEWLSRETGEGYRLLSESEWEYAARAGTTSAYHFGSDISSSQANFGSNAGTVPVGSYPANAFGLHDVHGNAWEWVEDCWNDSYQGAPSDGSAWTSGNCERRVVRGGGYWWSDPRDIRSANRFRYTSGVTDYDVGFRVARTLAP